MATTTISVTSTGQNFVIPGTMSCSDAVEMYGSEISGMANMACERTVSDSGDVTLRYSPRTGNKG